MNIAIIGCNRGIGLALTEELTQTGHSVYGFCRHSSKELKALNAKSIITGFEVTNLEDMESQLKTEGLPVFDQVFHVAGIMRQTSLDDFDIESIVEQFEVNSVAPILTVKALLPYLAKNSKVGLLTSRMGSIEDNDSGGAYGYRMSKAALNAAGKSLSIDLLDQGITILLLHPGWVKTDMTNQTGLLDPATSAKGLIEVMNSKDIKETGTFWHMNGEPLPW